MHVVVIVPTFNRGYILDRTLQSVSGQTYTRWTCWVVDDGSTDDTEAVVQRWQARDKRFRYVRQPENRGGVAANEVGMQLACDHGDVWVRLGSDDYFEPHKLKLDVVTLQNGVDACWGPYRDLHSEVPRDYRGLPMAARSALLSGGFAASWANIAVRTSILRALKARYGRFADPRIRNMEDWLINTRVAHLTDLTWRGLTRDGLVVIGAASIGEVPGVDPATGEGLVFDAVWRVGADGASQKPEQCNFDAEITREVLREDAEQFRAPDGSQRPCFRVLKPYEHGVLV